VLETVSLTVMQIRHLRLHDAEQTAWTAVTQILHLRVADETARNATGLTAAMQIPHLRLHAADEMALLIVTQILRLHPRGVDETSWLAATQILHLHDADETILTVATQTLHLRDEDEMAPNETDLTAVMQTPRVHLQAAGGTYAPAAVRDPAQPCADLRETPSSRLRFLHPSDMVSCSQDVHPLRAEVSTNAPHSTDA
jgi:hypothetical protein